MNLPRHLLLRIRRAIRRQLMSPATLSGLRWPANRPDPQPPEPPKKRPMKALFLITLAVIIGLFALGLSSCTGIGAGITGQAPHTTPVQRVDGSGQPVNIATRDLIRAETSPPSEAWGLYSIRNVSRATQVVTDAGK